MQIKPVNGMHISLPLCAVLFLFSLAKSENFRLANGLGNRISRFSGMLAH